MEVAHGVPRGAQAVGDVGPGGLGLPDVDLVRPGVEVEGGVARRGHAADVARVGGPIARPQGGGHDGLVEPARRGGGAAREGRRGDHRPLHGEVEDEPLRVLVGVQQGQAEVGEGRGEGVVRGRDDVAGARDGRDDPAEDGGRGIGRLLVVGRVGEAPERGWVARAGRRDVGERRGEGVRSRGEVGCWERWPSL